MSVNVIVSVYIFAKISCRSKRAHCLNTQLSTVYLVRTWTYLTLGKSLEQLWQIQSDQQHTEDYF